MHTKENAFFKALHTWSHSNLTTSPSDEVVFAEIIWNMRAVKEVIGVVPKYFRAPYGALSPKIRGLLTSLGLKIVFWNLDSEEYDLLLLLFIIFIIALFQLLRNLKLMSRK